MARASVEEEIACSPDALWQLIRDFGNVSWFQGVSKCEVEGSGPGMVRAIHVGDGPPIRERLERFDDATRTLTYSIPEGIPFPVKSYEATMVVSDAGAGRCRLDWSCECDPDGVTEQEAVATIQGMYGVLVGWLREAVEDA